MKTSIFIQQGDVQLVLTPENEFERNALKALLPEGEITSHVMRGQFYECQGGWWRTAPEGYAGKTHDSFILRTTAQEPSE